MPDTVASLYEQLYPLANVYKIHTFTSGGTFTVTGSGDVEYLIVGGGGGAGGSDDTPAGSGGGAGGYRTATSNAVTAQTYTITVGSGGAGGTGNASGSAGNDSVFNSITSSGGGGGSAFGTPSTNGGSGGGKGWYQSSNGSGNTPSTSPSQGNDGGLWASSDANYQAGAGGGGSGAVGGGITTNTQNGANGGIGTLSSITGSNIYYAGGGAGGSGGGTSVVATGGTGGSGIGGDGGNTSTTGTNGTSGTTNTGSGGGGGAGFYPYVSGQSTGGTGGSGIVIIRYKTTSGITATGGTTTFYNASLQRVVENFSGSVLNSDRWNITTTGNGTATMTNESNGGLKITSDSNATGNAMISFNVKCQYNPLGSVCIFTAKRTAGTTASQILGGFSSNNATNEDVLAMKDYSGTIKKQLATADNGQWTTTDTTVDVDTEWHNFKLSTVGGTNATLSVDGLTEVTHTVSGIKVPNVKLQPFFFASDATGTSPYISHGQIRYMEAYNT